MTLKLKSLLLVLALGIFSIVAVAVENHVAKARYERMMTNELAEKEILLKILLKINGKSLKTLSIDYTVWHEMRAFAENKDQAWAKENIDTALVTFGADAAWVTTLDGSVIYSCMAPAIQKLPISPNEGFGRYVPLFKESVFSHFFLSRPEGVWEIRGAGACPSFDYSRQIPPTAYFFVAKLWGKEEFGQLSALIGGTVRLIGSPKEAPESLKSIVDPRRCEIVFYTPLFGADAKPAAYLETRVQFKKLALFMNIRRNMLYGLLAFIGLFLLVVYFFLIRMVDAPVKRIQSALRNERPEYLAMMQNARDEFGGLAKVVIDYILQKKQLNLEIQRRQETESALRKSQARFQDIAEKTGDWLWEIGRDGRYQYVSGSVRKILGYAPEEVVGKFFYDFYELSDRDGMKQQAFQLFAKKKAFHHVENRWVRKDGTIAWVLVNGIPNFDGKGEFIGFRGVCSDITELKKAEIMLKEKLAELERMNRFMVDRELRIAELKEKLKGLES